MPSFFPRTRRIVVSFVIASAIIAAVLFGAVTRAEFDPAAMFGSPISATKTDVFIGGDGDGKADPGETIGYTVQVINGGTDLTGVTFTDTIDPNTTLNGGSIRASAVAVDDTFPVILLGNHAIDSTNITGGPYSVLTNDYRGTNPVVNIASFDALSANGGNVTMNLGNGQFTYDPPAGFEGTDTFTYVLADNPNATSAASNRTGTVSITVSGMVWFIDNNAAACVVAGCGRRSNPFSTLAAFNALNNGTGLNPATSDRIFVFESATAYTGGVTLLPIQRFIGQDAQDTLANITGYTPPVGSTPFPAMNLGAPATTITNAAGNGITLDNGNLVRGFTVSGASASGIAGVAATNTAIIAGNNDVTITGTNGVAVGNGALAFNGGSGAITFSGTISGNAGDAVNIRNRTGGITTIQGPVSSNTRGVVLDNNDGATILFTQGLSLSTGPNAAFTAINGGTVAATQNNGTIVNTLTTTSGTALNVSGTNIGSAGITFRSIASNGGATGIVLNNTGTTAGTHGGLTVTGNSAGQCGGGVTVQPVGTANTITNPVTGDCTGGTITAKTGDAISIVNSRDASLTRMYVHNNLGSGLFGDDLTNLTILNSFFDNNSDTQTGVEANLRFNELLGSCAITNSTIQGAPEDEIRMTPTSGTLTNLAISGTTIGNDFNDGTEGCLPCDRGNGITISPSVTAATTVNLTNSVIKDIFAAGVVVNGDGTTARTFNSSNTTYIEPTNDTAPVPPGGVPQQFGGVGMSLQGSFSSDLNCNVSNNTFLGLDSNAINFSIGTTATNDADVLCTINGNVIGNASADSGSRDAIGIAMESQGDADTVVFVTNNSTQHSDQQGFFAQSRLDNDADGQTGRFDLILRDNNFGVMDDNTTFPFFLVHGATIDSRNTSTLCLDSFSNTASTVGGAERFMLRNRDTSIFEIERFDDGDANFNEIITTPSTVQTFHNGQNDAGSSTLATLTGTFRGFDEAPDNTCRNAPTPGNTLRPGFGEEGWYDLSSMLDDFDQGHVRVVRSEDSENRFPQPAPRKRVENVETPYEEVPSASVEVRTEETLTTTEQAAAETSWFTNIASTIHSIVSKIFAAAIPTASAQNVDINRTTKPFAILSGETVNFGPINTLPAGKSVTLTFNVTVDTLDAGEIRTRILNQGTADSNETAGVLTTDPTPNGDPACAGTVPQTCTPVDRPDTTINSINRDGASPTNAASVSWTATFGTQIAGLTATNFTLVNTGPCAGAPAITAVTPIGGSPATGWTVTASTGTGSCTLGLNLANDGGLSHDITTALPFVGQTIVIDKLAPSTTSFVRFNPLTSPTNADTLLFRATFSENVIGVDLGDFTVTGTTATVMAVAGVGAGPNFTQYDLTVSGGDLAGLNGTVDLNFNAAAPANFITDLATNDLPKTEPAIDETYLVDNTAPTVDIIDITPDPRNTSVATVAINFNESVTGFDMPDLTLTRDGGANLLPGGATVSGGPTNYTLGSLAAITGTDGTYLLTVAAPGGITDAAGNALVVGATDSWIKDAAAPTVTINQAVGQSDPTFANPINFTAIFNEPVTDFDDAADVVVTGTAAGVGTATVVITPNSSTNYTVAISGITGDGTVIANIPAGVAIDAATNANVASTSTDNTVTFVTCVLPPANMIAWYTGDGTPRDIAGGNDGSLVGGATYAAGKVGQAFSFPTAPSYVNRAAGAPSPLNLTGTAVTIDGWINPTTTTAAIYFGKTASGSNDYLLLNPFGSQVQALVRTTTGETGINAFADFPTNTVPYLPATGVWTHIAMTYDGATVKIYANGVQIGSGAKTGNLSGSNVPFNIGGRAAAGLQFNGLIDEVEVFNRALLQSDIQAIVAADGGGKCKPFDLRIDKEDVNAPFDQGAAESYTIVVTNDGPATTGGTTTVSDTFPTGVTPGAATGTNWTCNTAAQLVTCTSTQAVTAGNVFPTITVPVTVAQNAGASVSNTATVATSPAAGELDTSDNLDTEVTAVTGVALTPNVTNGSTLEDTQTPNGQLVITPNAMDGSEVTHYKITNIQNGSLFQNNGTTPIPSGSFITVAQGAAGLRFTPALNFFGNGAFDVQASTSASDAGLGGSIATATITVTPVNDAPTLNDPADVTIVEDAGLQTVNLSGITPGPTNESGQSLVVTASSDNTALIPNPTVSYTSPNATGSLALTPVANQSGTANITVTVTDNGGTANGGVNSFSQVFVVTVNAINDAPTLNDPADVTILEDAALQTVNLSGVTAGPNETQVLTVTSTSDNTGLIPNPTVTYTSPNTTGSLAFTPVANQSGTAIVTVTVTDNGGTANGGVNTFSQTFMVTVTAVNDAPTLNDPADVTMFEDAALQTVNLSGITAGPLESQTLVVTATSNNTGLIPNPTVTYTSPNTTGSLAFTPIANQSGTAVVTVTVTDNGGTANGGVNTFSQTFTVNVTPVNDAPTLNDPPDMTILEDAAVQTVNLTGITAGPSETQILTVTSSSNNTGLIPNPTVSYTSANTTGTLTFTPVANANGTAIVTVTVTDDGGTANGGVNTFSQTFTVNVTAVNDPPTFTAGPNVTRVVNQGPQTVNPWATGITTGPANESGQAITGFTITGNSNAALFSAQPAVSNAGVLTFTSAAGATGTATITLTLSDNGGTANGGSDTSAPQTFTITINPGSTTTGLTSSPNPSALGAPVTFTATVTANAPSGGVPQGTVEFRDNNVAVGTGTLNGTGVATFTTSTLTSGSHPITAVYLGSPAFNGSTSPVLIQVVDLPPTATGTAPNVVTGGGTTHTVTVTYTDDFAINVASLDSNDIRVTGPNAFNSAVTFTGVNINTNGTPRVATYTFNAPGGSWDLGDNGTYSIVMQANQVVDSANQPVAAGSIGTFVVNIPPVTISGNVRQYVAGGPNTPLAGVTVTLTSNNVPVPGPATTNANGDYVITNVSHGANVVVTPSGLGKVYDPITRTFNNVTANTTADFIAYDPNAIPRTIRVVDTYPAPGAAVAVPIVMNSQGTETSVSFSLNFNINPLAANPTATCGAAAAAGCTVTFNNATPGQIGVTITNPVSFTAGPAEIAVINFQTLANSSPSTPLTFGDAPVVRLVRDGNGNPLPATYINGLIVFAQGIEGDVANRNTGNGTFESGDVVQMRRFVAGLDIPVVTNNEFQRADTAPASAKGDGNLNSTDLVQTRRYVAGLDASQSAGGPGAANAGPVAPPSIDRSNGAPLTEIVVGSASGSTESRVTIPVGMRSNGDEIAVNFVIRYDARRLGNAEVQLASAAFGTTLTANADEPGVIRVLVDSSTPFARSKAIETLLNISFDIASTAPTGDTRIVIEETTISDDRATSLAWKATNGSISIAGPNAVALEISGRVLTPIGAGLRNATVTITDAKGITRTATTATFGYYRFEGLIQGETYILAVTSRRFRFSGQRITPSNSLTVIDFTGQE